MTQQSTTKLLIQLKQKKTKKPLTFQQLICILNQGAIKPIQVKRYLKQIHDTQNKPLNWLDLQFEKIQEISIQSYKYIIDHRQLWKQQQIKKKQQEQQKILMQQQRQRIKLQMIKKNLTRDKMIQMCKDSIIRCQKILQVGVSDPEQYQRINQTVKQLKRQLLILQGMYFQQMIQKGQQPPLVQQDNTEFYLILEQLRQRKRKQKQQKKQAVQKFKKQERQMYLTRFKKIIKKLRDIYQHYSKIMYTPGSTFEENSQHMRLMDMKVFVKYIKEFDFGKYNQILNLTNKYEQDRQDNFNRSKTQKSILKKSIQKSQFLSKIKNDQMVYQRKSNQNYKKITNMFKTIADHGIWMDFQKFIQFHFRLIESKENLQFQDLKIIIRKEEESMLIDLGILVNKKRSIDQNQKQSISMIKKEPKISNIKSKQKIDENFNQQKQCQNQESSLKDKISEETISQKIRNLNKLNLLLSKQKMQKVLRIGLNYDLLQENKEHQKPSKGLKKNPIQTIMAMNSSSNNNPYSKINYHNNFDTDQKKNLLQKMSDRIEQRKRQQLILKQKISLAKKLFQENKAKRLKRFSQQNQSPYHNRYQKLNQMNSNNDINFNTKIKSISSQRLKQLINSKELQIGSYNQNKLLKNRGGLSSLPKLGMTSNKRPVSIYQSLKKFKLQNLMLDQQVNLLGVSTLLEKKQQNPEKNLTNNEEQEEDQQYLNQFFARQRKQKKKNKNKITSGKSQSKSKGSKQQSRERKIKSDKNNIILSIANKQQPRMRFT